MKGHAAAALILLWASIGLAGQYEVQGTHSRFGNYRGEVRVQGETIQRRIRFARKQDEDGVETVWVGRRASAEAVFDLATSRVLTEIDGYRATDEELRAPVRIALSYPPEGELRFEVPGEGSYVESWVEVPDTAAAASDSLWIDRREIRESTGQVEPFLVRLARFLVIDKVIDWYREQVAASPWSFRPEVVEQKQYSIRDKTDFEFYRTHPSVLRIANQRINPLSLAEARMRRNAYGKTLATKARELGAETARLNLNDAGLLELAEVDAGGVKVRGVPEGDSALWSAMYGMAETLRFEATGDPEAAKNFRKVLDGILTLVEITGDPSQFARALAVSPASEVWDSHWVQGVGRHSHLKWLRGGNNDMIKGVFITLTLASRMIGPEEAGLRSRIQRVVEALPALAPVGRVGGNSGIAQGIRALYTRNIEDLNDFSRSEDNLLILLQNWTGIESGFYFGGEADWSGVHLTAISSLCLLLISRELAEVFPYHPYGYQARRILKRTRNELLAKQKTYERVPEDFVTLLTYAFVPETRNDGAFKDSAREALWSLYEVPSPRKVGAGAAELKRLPQWSISAWPRLPWKALKGNGGLKKDLKFENFIQGAYRYPIFESLAWQSTYLWKDGGYESEIRNTGNIVSFSSDYLLAYWIARSAGLISSEN